MGGDDSGGGGTALYMAMVVVDGVGDSLHARDGDGWSRDVAEPGVSKTSLSVSVGTAP